MLHSSTPHYSVYWSTNQYVVAPAEHTVAYAMSDYIVAVYGRSSDVCRISNRDSSFVERLTQYELSQLLRIANALHHIVFRAATTRYTRWCCISQLNEHILSEYPKDWCTYYSSVACVVRRHCSNSHPCDEPVCICACDCTGVDLFPILDGWFSALFCPSGPLALIPPLFQRKGFPDHAPSKLEEILGQVATFESHSCVPLKLVHDRGTCRKYTRIFRACCIAGLDGGGTSRAAGVTLYLLPHF